MRLGRPLFGAEDQAHGWVLAGFHPVLAGVVQVEMNLPSIGVAELADLEVDDHQTLELAVEKQQIDAEPVVVDAQAALAADEAEVVAQFQQEVGQMLDQRVFEIGFGIGP